MRIWEKKKEKISKRKKKNSTNSIWVGEYLRIPPPVAISRISNSTRRELPKIFVFLESFVSIEKEDPLIPAPPPPPTPNKEILPWHWEENKQTNKKTNKDFIVQIIF